MPAADDWQAALALRDSARREIARYCGEPDLVEVDAARKQVSGND
jgi:hypothetical protein